MRLVFLPTLVVNRGMPAASVKGTFVYQRKRKNDEWQSMNTESLQSVKSGETYKLELKSSELFKLGNELRDLYRLSRQEGLPQGQQEFVRVQAGLSRFFSLSEPNLRKFLEQHPEDAVSVLVKLLDWLTGSQAIRSIPSKELPSVNSLLGLIALKQIVAQWAENQQNDSEQFWQELLSRYSAVLSQIFAYPIVVIREKAYMGGKQLDNTGGREVDFLARALATRAAVLIEIKTPMTRLLGREYRGVHPLSAELSGAIAQVLHYRQSLMANHSLIDAKRELLQSDPRCVVIAGNGEAQLANDTLKNNFELLRDRVSGVTVLTFDELFSRVQQSIELLEDWPGDSA